MISDRQMLISTAGHRKSTSWPASKVTWSDFVKRFEVPVYGTETYDEYLHMSKAEQSERKDVGGFVGGTFDGDRRKSDRILGRDLVTLDLDNIKSRETDVILSRVEALQCSAVVYSTRKHSQYAPRLRVVIPTDRTMSPDEYEPIARRLGSLLGMENCDPTTFEVARMMFWPSCSQGGEYVYRVYDKAFCSADGILGTYSDWQDVRLWPVVPGSDAAERRRLARQTDPTTKPGIVGAFCRTYSITEAIEKFIPGMYEPTADPGRYTYTGGSTAVGAVIYDDDKFLFSHHATDPCSGELVNSFDLIRLHKFSKLDDDAKEGTPAAKMPSYIEMARFAADDADTKARLMQERVEAAQEAFRQQMAVASGTASTPPEDADMSWISQLRTTDKGAIASTINNAVIVLLNDPMIKGKPAVDEFSCRGITTGALPWNGDPEPRIWTDTDDAGLYQHMEATYGITGREKIDTALMLAVASNKVNEVRDYLEGLKWDGVKRVETLLPDYLGSEDNIYTRAVMRKALTAAVVRAVVGGVKYDYMPIFAGPQGIGKSTFLANLGRKWFSDSLTTFEGKEAAEMIQGTWINEVGELSAFTKQETQVIKQFLSKREDIYRAAYGRRTDKYLRRCVFFGTSNDVEFLRDATGNRRFWPVDVGVQAPTKDVWEDMPAEVDQIWAEAYVYYLSGESLFLSHEENEMAIQQQDAHREVSSHEGAVIEYVEAMVPESWHTLTKEMRRMYLTGNMAAPEGIRMIKKDRVCIAEIWEEAIGGKLQYIKTSDKRDISNILTSLGWRRTKSSVSFGPYGKQRGFERP